MLPSPQLRSARASLRTRLSAWLVDLGSPLLVWFGRLRAQVSACPAWIGWFLYTVVCFGLFVVLTFPFDLLLQRVIVALNQDSPIRVRYAHGEWTWDQGWVLHDLVVQGPATSLATLRLSRLTLQPTLTGLLSNQPFPLTFSAEVFGGTVKGTLRRNASGFAAEFALHQLALDRWPFLVSWGQVAGHVSAEGRFQGNPADLTSVHGTVSVTLTNGALQAGTIARYPLPTLQTVHGHLRATLTGGRLEIADLELTADGVRASVHGGVVLRTPLTRSILDLQLTAQITGSPPRSLTALLSLLPAAAGTKDERRASITGFLAAPVVR